jgi:hypothetical protein
VEPENLKFGGGLAYTIFNPVVAAVVIVVGLMICLGSRKKALAAFLATALLIPTDQVLVVWIFHFPVVRLLIAFGFARLLWTKATSKSEIFSGGMNRIDKAVVILVVFAVIDGVLLWRQSGALIKLLGELYSAIGIYSLLRHLIRDEEDVRRTMRVIAYVTMVVAIVMAVEQLTGRNLIYTVLGGARAVTHGWAFRRDNEFRAMGPFAHPILAGTFGATVLPLFMALWWKKNRKLAVAGLIAATVVSVAANSSTSLLGYAGGIVALCFWPLRKLMRPFRWGIVATLVSLHLVMKSPVWHLISDIDLTGSSSSYHRYQLVNQCIRHFWDWFPIGSRDYADWGWNMWDLSNQYVALANTVGFVPLIAFLVIIITGFQYIGRARRASEGNRRDGLFLWAIGSALFANVVAFFGISYFDQTIVAWYALVAMIPAATAARIANLAPQLDREMVEQPPALNPRLAHGPLRGGLPE